MGEKLSAARPLVGAAPISGVGAGRLDGLVERAGGRRSLDVDLARLGLGGHRDAQGQDAVMGKLKAAAKKLPGMTASEQGSGLIDAALIR